MTLRIKEIGAFFIRNADGDMLLRLNQEHETLGGICTWYNTTNDGFVELSEENAVKLEEEFMEYQDKIVDQSIRDRHFK